MNPFAFLIDILIHLYTVVLMLRLLLQWVRADFYNPVSQFIVKVTSPLVVPLRKVIPGYWGIDFATLLLVLVITAIKLVLIALINGASPGEISALGLALKTVFDTINLLLNIFLFSIIVQAILSWVNPDPYNPVVSLLHSITWPVLKPFRKLLPPISGIDLSPIFAIITIMFIKQTIVYFL